MRVVRSCKDSCGDGEREDRAQGGGSPDLYRPPYPFSRCYTLQALVMRSLRRPYPSLPRTKLNLRGLCRLHLQGPPPCSTVQTPCSRRPGHLVGQRQVTSDLRRGHHVLLSCVFVNSLASLIDWRWRLCQSSGRHSQVTLAYGVERVGGNSVIVQIEYHFRASSGGTTYQLLLPVVSFAFVRIENELYETLGET